MSTTLSAPAPPDIYPVGPYGFDVNADLAAPYSSAGKPGITAALKAELQKLVAQGYKLGIYDLNTGPSRSSTDVHARGLAADVDFVNGQQVGLTNDPTSVAFAEAVLADPGTRVGAGGALYSTLEQAGYGSRVFVDDPTHIHVDVAGDVSSLQSTVQGVLTAPNPLAGLIGGSIANTPGNIAQATGVAKWWPAISADVQYWLVNFGLAALALAVMAGGFAIAAGKDTIEKGAMLAA